MQCFGASLIAICGPFSGVKRSKKRQIAAALWIRQQQPLGQPMINGLDEIKLRQRATLIVRDRDKWCIGEAGDKGMHMRQIEPAVQRGDKRPAKPPQQRNVDPIQVAMNDVEFVSAAGHTFEQSGERRHWINRRAAQPQRLGEIGTSSAFVFEPPLANSVTLSPKPTSSSVSQETTRSVPP